MKRSASRLLSALLALCLVLALLPGTALGAEGKGYTAAVQQAIEDMQAYRWGKGYGALYDVDGNGIDELMMVYTIIIKTNEGFEYPAKVCSVYTMSNGTAVQLINKEVLFAEAGGPSGYAAVVRDNGNIYFAITSETGETGDAPGYSINRYGKWKLYTIDGKSVNLDKDVEYDYFIDGKILYEKSTATINGQKYSYKDYEIWKNSLEEILRIDPYGNESAMTLEALLKYLKDHPIEDDAKSPGPDGVFVTVNGKNVDWTDAKPYVDKNNRTMVPFRAVANVLGLTVAWDGDAGKDGEASFSDGAKTITFPVGSSVARKSDGGTVTMTTETVNMGGRVYAPIRYLAEYFGYTVGWDGPTSTVSITK